MNTGNFYYPLPSNEPVLNFAPGSTERALVKNAIKELKSQKKVKEKKRKEKKKEV